jgi:hypothetical protein
MQAPYAHIDDTASFHSTALLDPEPKSARVMTWSKTFNWNDIVAAICKLYPEWEVSADFLNSPESRVTVDDV